jgi:hypothetical protein
MLGIPYDQVDPEQREIGKVLNYAVLYGKTAHGVAEKLQIEGSRAAILFDDFWKTYPLLKKWIDYRKEYCRKHARTYTVLGRTRELREVFAKEETRKKAAMRQAVNTAGQGSCGDALKLALVNLKNAAKTPGNLLHQLNCEIRCPVFDAVLLEMDIYPEDQRGTIERAILDQVEVMLNWEGRYTVMKAHVGWSTNNWAEACGKGVSTLVREEADFIKIDQNQETRFEIWAEGYRASGDSAPAHLVGTSYGKSFKEAVERYADSDISFRMNYDPDKMTHWGCNLFDNETDAKKVYG